MTKAYYCKTVGGNKYCCPDGTEMYEGGCCPRAKSASGIVKYDTNNCSNGVPFPPELTDSSRNTEIEYKGNTYRDLDPDFDQ